MNRHHLTYLDRALARLVEERARLVRGADPRAAAPAVEDLLRRSDGELPAAAFRGVFASIEEACAAAAETAGEEVGP